jgi:hypothetical protein
MQLVWVEPCEGVTGLAACVPFGHHDSCDDKKTRGCGQAGLAVQQVYMRGVERW